MIMARKKDSGRLYALKIMNKAQLGLQDIKAKTLANEVLVNEKLRDLPFIVPCHWAF